MTIQNFIRSIISFTLTHLFFLVDSLLHYKGDFPSHINHTLWQLSMHKSGFYYYFSCLLGQLSIGFSFVKWYDMLNVCLLLITWF